MAIAQEADRADARQRDSLSTLKDVKNVLREQLSTLAQPESFASHGSMATDIEPSLCHHTIGPIDLPLTEQSVNQLCPTRASSTLGGAPATSTIPGDQLKITNPAFSKLVDNLVGNAIEGLGVPIKCRSAPLSRLVILEKGKSRSLNMAMRSDALCFLAVFLATPHTGGDMTLSFGRESLKFSTSPDRISWAYWHRGAQLSVDKIETGHVACLWYPISEVGTRSVPRTLPRLEAGLRAWVDNKCMPSELIHVLRHDYSTTAHGLDDLFGADATNMSGLLAMSQDLGYKVLLARMSLTIKKGGGKYGDGWAEYDRKIQLKQVYDLAGFTLVEKVGIADEIVIQDNFYRRKADEQQKKPWEDEPRRNDIYNDSVSRHTK